MSLLGNMGKGINSVSRFSDHTRNHESRVSDNAGALRTLGVTHKDDVGTGIRS